MTDDKTQAKADAQACGLSQRRAGWHDALLVARSCEPGTGGPRQPRTSAKLSLKEFAEESGLSETQVRLLYKAWQLCATDPKAEAQVQNANALNPGDDDSSIEELADTIEERQKLWRYYYDKAKKPEKPKEKPAPAPVIVTDEESEESEDEESEDAEEFEDNDLTVSQLAEVEPQNEALLELLEELRTMTVALEDMAATDDEKEIDLLDQIATESEQLTKVARERIAK